MTDERLGLRPPDISVKDISCIHGKWCGKNGPVDWAGKMDELLDPFGRSVEDLKHFEFVPDDPVAAEKAGGHGVPGTIKITFKK